MKLDKGAYIYDVRKVGGEGVKNFDPKLWMVEDGGGGGREGVSGWKVDVHTKFLYSRKRNIYLYFVSVVYTFRQF